MWASSSTEKGGGEAAHHSLAMTGAETETKASKTADAFSSNPGDGGPVLSPVLARPVRSLSSSSSQLRSCNAAAVSDSEPELVAVWAAASVDQRRRKPNHRVQTSPTPPTCISPILARSISGSKLTAAPLNHHRHSGGGSGAWTAVGGVRASLTRCDSDTGDRPMQRYKRRPSTVTFPGMYSQISVESAASSSGSNLIRLHKSSLGHSDPQISASCSSTSNSSMSHHHRATLHLQLRKEVHGRGGVNSRRSLNASTSPVLGSRCRSPNRSSLLACSSSSTAPSCSVPKTVPLGVPLRSYCSRSGSTLMAPTQQDSRRWSVASLPSSSGYGTPGSNSAFSSQYSSQEHLADMMAELRVGTRFDSNDSNPSADDSLGTFRPRSRSLNSPAQANAGGLYEGGIRSNVYKERFPKAKTQMETRLEAFIEQNDALSSARLTSSTELNVHQLDNQTLQQTNTSQKVMGDGATRFLHRQIVELANDCLTRSRAETISCVYFCELSQRLDELLAEAQQKTGNDSMVYLTRVVKQLLMIVARPARLLECLEFDPDEFYHLLEEAEGAVRKQLGSGTARVPDLPQYIISKLGLDRDPIESLESPDGNNAKAEGNTPTFEETPSCPMEEKTNRPPCEDDFESIRLVSNGAYGAVYLVRHRETRQRFALKKLSKQTLILRNQVEQVFAERDILTFTDNPFVVSFYGSFETRSHLCMLMEYVEGGDCAALLKMAGTLPVDVARLYLAEAILAVEYLHSYGIVHRDLKPDNFLITAMGHIKLTDFGLSKIGLMNRTTLVGEGSDADCGLCGTPEYIAPEVILRQGYGKPVDWWALGIILYEFLIGTVPFLGDSPEQLFSSVIHDEVEYPEGDEAMPLEAENLIRQLLEKNPFERLGTAGGAVQLTAHAFFSGLDFTSLLRQKAEFVPQLENEEDTSYFDTRCDRYNHDAESGDEDCSSTSTMFRSFGTASPRHSIVGIEGSPHPLALLAASNPEWLTRNESEDAAGDPNEPETPLDCPLTSAVLLRRRFSAQRQSQLSTSSSGTPGQNTGCSSTDSSMEAAALLPFVPGRGPSPLPRVAISCDPDDSSIRHTVAAASSIGTSSIGVELSPVDERRTKTPPNNSHLITGSRLESSSGNLRQRRSSGRATALQLVIPGSPGPSMSPGSLSSGSSFESASPNTIVASTSSSMAGNNDSTGRTGNNDSMGRTGNNDSTGSIQLSPQATTSGLKAPIIIRKGPKGFGFTIRSVRVYVSETSEYYTIQHIVTDVEAGSPAFEAGLRKDDLITHVHGEPVNNLSHPLLMHRLLAFGNQLALKVMPLSSTSIREGAARKTAGKLAKKKPKRPQRRVPLEKKPRKPSSLLRRLSGKRPTGEILPGTSSQKQAFIPRSVSSQECIGASGPIGPSTSPIPPAIPIAHQKRLSDVGLRMEDNLLQGHLGVNRPSTLQGLKHKVSGVSQHLNTPRKHHTITTPMPVSPLARQETVPSPTRSPSPAPYGNVKLVNKLLKSDSISDSSSSGK